MPNSPPTSFLSSCLRWILAAATLFAAWGLPVSASEEKGCEGVGFATRRASEYSPGKLKERIQSDRNDVDALIHLGIHLEEQNELSEAEALYARTILAKPDCSLGYLFAGLVRNRISSGENSRAEADIRKAVTLNPSLRMDGNVQGFLSQHPNLWGIRPVTPAAEEPWAVRQVLATANHFFVGLGVGLFLATLVFFVAGRRSA